MKHRTKRLIGLVAASITVLALHAGFAGPSPDKIDPPPVSLKKYYPPRDMKRTYTRSMLELGRLMGSVSMDLRNLGAGMEGLTRATVGEELTRFFEQYRRVADMVPEWKSYYPAAALKQIETEFAKGADPGDLQLAMEKVEASCTYCHINEMFKLQVIYHWPRFSDVTSVDEEMRDVDFHDNMVALSNHMGALTAAVGRGNMENAQEHRRQIASQFSLMEASCENCHEDTREYFVDKAIKGRILKVGAMIKQDVKDRSQYETIMDQIYELSCIPCHQVHMPAAYLQMQLSRN